MVFSSTPFLFLFLPVVLFLYYVVLRTVNTRNILLFVSSLIFYAWGEPLFVFVLVVSIIMSFIFGKAIGKFKDNIAASRFIIIIMLIYNLSIIFVCKYLMFFLHNTNMFFGLDIPVPQITLPIGISFFTFHAISYVIDIYRNKSKAQRSILNVGLYIAFFPQLVAGPIVRYQTIADQIANRKETVEDFTKGCCRFLYGLSKKVLIANTMAVVANRIFSEPASLGVLVAWLGAISYTFQIYFDFSGYSDMAIGLGKMFGFHFDENFRYPYISKSITEFWRRWHISLSSWFRDYVYIPLGGSRVKSNIRLVFNLLVVWFLTGLWHGASWNFIIWGLLYFVLLVIEKLLFSNYVKEADKKPVILKLLGHLYTMFFVIIGWVIFRSDNLFVLYKYLRSMFGFESNGISINMLSLELSSKLPFYIFAIILSFPVFEYIGNKINKLKDRTGFKPLYYITQGIYTIVMIILFIISNSYIIKGTYNPFIYFNF